MNPTLFLLIISALFPFLALLLGFFQYYYLMFTVAGLSVMTILAYLSRSELIQGIRRIDIILLIILGCAAFTLSAIASGTWDPYHSSANVHIEQVWSVTEGHRADPYPPGYSLFLFFLLPFGIDHASIHLLGIILFMVFIMLSYLAGHLLSGYRSLGVLFASFFLLDRNILYWSGTAENAMAYLIFFMSAIILLVKQRKSADHSLSFLFIAVLFFIPTITPDFLFAIPLFIIASDQRNAKAIIMASMLAIPSLIYLAAFSPYLSSGRYLLIGTASSLLLSFPPTLFSVFASYQIPYGILLFVILLGAFASIRNRNDRPLFLFSGYLFTLLLCIYHLMNTLSSPVFYDTIYMVRMSIPFYLFFFLSLVLIIRSVAKANSSRTARIAAGVALVLFIVLQAFPGPLGRHAFQEYEASITEDAVEAVIAIRAIGPAIIIQPFENHFRPIIKRETGHSDDIGHLGIPMTDVPFYYIEPEFCWIDRKELFFPGENSFEDRDRCRLVWDRLDLRIVDEIGNVRIYEAKKKP